MKQFLQILFGGLLAVGSGLVMVWGLLQGAEFVLTRLSGAGDTGLQNTATVSNMNSDKQIEQTSIFGLTKIIRYTATEEENMINDTANLLPSGADNRITAGAYYIKDLTTGVEVARYNQDKLMPIASLTKLITAIVAQKLIPADTRITISKDVMATYGNTAGFKVGETFTMNDLMYPLLMVSSNDAAEAYARQVGRMHFIQAMNDFTQSIGAYRTYFADPSGLSPENKATASDMAIIVNWIRIHAPDILSITDLKSKTIRNHTWVNPTHFLSWSYYLGGKNGYTDEADRTSVSLFAIGRAKDVYAMVVLGSDNRDSDVMKLLKKIP